MNVHVPSQKPSLPTSNPLGPIAFLGEAPSDEEEEKGVPLVGPSGRIFNACLRTAKIDRRECWVGNVFDEKLPENEVKNWCISVADAREAGWKGFPPPIGGAGVLRAEYTGHLARLERELAALKPSLIVPLGGTALWALTGSNAIGEHRGAPSVARLGLPGVKIFPTFHPAFIQKDWRYFAVVVGDLIRAQEHSRKEGLALPDIKAVLEPDLLTLEQWDKAVMGADLLSADIETGWGHILCIGLSPSPREALVVPFVDLRQPDKSYWKTAQEELETLEIVKRWLESPVPKLGQNFAMYDAYWTLERWGIRPVNLREDTRILHHALYPELPKDLGFMGASYTDQGPWKMMRERKREKKED